MRMLLSISQALLIIFSSPLRTQNVRRFPHAIQAGDRDPVGAGSKGGS